jgi:hypothetical protein
MTSSKGKLLNVEAPESAFAEMAFKALLRAQRVAARENARWGMKLIVQETRPVRRKSASRKPARPRSAATGVKD